MRYYAADYRKYARNALAGNWGTALGVALVAALLGGGVIGLLWLVLALV